MEIRAAQSYRTGLVTATDGTRISYRQIGGGPGLILVPGGMQAAQNFMTLGGMLSDAFTVSILNRRGRSLSGPFGKDHGIQTEVDDLDVLLRETGAQNVFGLSSGALLSLQAALTLPSLSRLALYEPPLVLEGDAASMAWVPRYDEELARGNLAGAMVACMKGAGDRGDFFTALPRFLLVALMQFAIKADAKNVKADEASLESLIRSFHFDNRIVAEMAGTLDKFRTISAEVLLLGGSRSPAFLAAALDALSGILPHARCVTLSGLGHLAADETGKPERVAKELRSFFAPTRTAYAA
jgi:pimeloyl-ACP methyl ester carboxylesterase